MANTTQKFDRIVRGPVTLTAAGSNTANAYWGLQSVTSHTVVVSTQMVAASSIIRLTTEFFPGSASPIFAVASKNPGNAFSIQCASWNLANATVNVGWEIVNPR